MNKAINIVDDLLENGAGWEPWMQRVLEQVREQYISERLKGFVLKGVDGNDVTYPPRSRSEAEAAWKKLSTSSSRS
jgi:hypothetical protein